MQLRENDDTFYKFCLWGFVTLSLTHTRKTSTQKNSPVSANHIYIQFVSFYIDISTIIVKTCSVCMCWMSLISCQLQERGGGVAAERDYRQVRDHCWKWRVFTSISVGPLYVLPRVWTFSCCVSGNKTETVAKGDTTVGDAVLTSVSVKPPDISMKCLGHFPAELIVTKPC